MRSVNHAALLLLLLLFTFSVFAQEEERVRPFVLAETSPTPLQEKLPAVIDALKQAGFTIAGEYTPYAGTHLLVITDPELQKQAARSTFGGYGAALRVSLTELESGVQVSYTNPQWMGHVYRMNGAFDGHAQRLRQALGWERGFGSEGGRTVSNLREYHYMMFMPYFDDQVELAHYETQQAAIVAVEAAMAAGQGGVGQVARVPVTGKDEVLYSVSIREGEGADEPVMKVVDQAELRHSAHLPYELLISEGGVYMLHGKFRIAQSFPDLTMSTFMKISDAPDGIEQALMQVAKGKPSTE